MISTRLWHYKLIPVLPKKMLIAQWRECIAIKRQWEKGTLKHRLVSYVMDYDRLYFYRYIILLINEMLNRDIRFNSEFVKEFETFCVTEKTNLHDLKTKYNELTYPEHNNRYLKQCYYNLQEKRDREILDWEEFDKIFKVCNEIINIVK